MINHRQRAAAVTISLLALLASGCAGHPRRFGDLEGRLARGAGHAFAMGEPGSQAGEATDAVRRALLDAGFKEAEDSLLVIEVGYAHRARALSLSGPGMTPGSDAAEARELTPAARRSLAFCRKQAHTLTIAAIDRTSGDVVARGGATLGRCAGDQATLLPELARAALASASLPQALAAK